MPPEPDDEENDDLQPEDDDLQPEDDGVEAEDTSDPNSVPFRSNAIRIEYRPTTVDLLKKRLQENEIDLAPDFQRAASLWKPRAKSRLIESMLIRIPIPAFYMDATNDEKWQVVDGLQRLTVLNEYVVKNEFELQELEFLKEFQGLRFDKLPRQMQRRIEETQLVVYLIQQGTPPEVKFNIFRRINTGGLPLSPQEIRHALYQGPATKMLSELASDPAFVKVAGGSIRNRRMVDREFVLRFLAFSMTAPEQYNTDFDRFLSLTMQKLNELNVKERAHLKEGFVRAMQLAWELFDRDAFRKRYKVTAQRKPINKALFETWSITLASLTKPQGEKLVARKTQLRKAFIELLKTNSDFDTAVTQGTGDRTKVQLRFALVAKLVKEVLK